MEEKYNKVLDIVSWDDDFTNLGLPSNMLFSFGSEFHDTVYKLQKPKDDIRWGIFRVDSTYYVIEQYKHSERGWLEVWTKQMNSDKEEAKNYAIHEAYSYYKIK